MDGLEAAQMSDFEDGTLAAAVAKAATFETDELAQAVLFEAARKLKWAANELKRRDRNELRNCINWGPCSTNDGSMHEHP